MLNVLIEKTLEQARMEVLEEHELAIIKMQSEEYQEVRNAELVEAQRYEAAEARVAAEIASTSGAGSRGVTNTSSNPMSRSMSAPGSRNGILELQKVSAVLLIQYQVRRRSKRTLAAMLAEEERWHE